MTTISPPTPADFPVPPPAGADEVTAVATGVRFTDAVATAAASLDPGPAAPDDGLVKPDNVIDVPELLAEAEAELDEDTAPAAPLAPLPPTMTHCPHCQWDLTIQAVPDPSEQDRHAFLQAWKGEIPYIRAYPICDGSMSMTFRRVTSYELDAVLQQARRDARKSAEITPMEFMDRYNQLLFCLRLSGFNSELHTHVLPQALSEDTAYPGVTKTWVELLNLPATDTEPLLAVERHIRRKVLFDESLFRVGLNHCFEFNRMLTKLEAAVQRKGFWNATGTPS